MNASGLARYRGIFVSTAGFAAFFLLYIGLNYSLQGPALAASEYASYASGLAQRIRAGGGSERAAVADEVAIFIQGGELQFDGGRALEVAPLQQHFVSSPPDLNAVALALATGDFEAALDGAREFGRRAEAEAQRKQRLLDTLQIAAAVLTVLLFVIITWQMIRRLSSADEVSSQTRDEAKGILNTVSEGLFLLSPNHEIGVEQSASLKDMFKQERDLEGNFFDFISQYVTQGDMQIARDYLELLFGDRVKEKLVADLNPLTNVEINIARRDGTFESRYLDFQFKRVTDDGKLRHLLGSVTDVTRQVVLERQLAEAQEAQEAQLDLLRSILHIDSGQLRAFFEGAERHLSAINTSLESQKARLGEHDIRGLLTEVAQQVHRIKGDAAALGLAKFEFSAHEFETTLQGLQGTATLGGRDLLPLTTQLRTMFRDLHDMQTLVEKFSGIVAAPAPGNGDAVAQPKVAVAADPNPSNDAEEKLRSLVSTVSGRNDSEVELTTSGLEAVSAAPAVEEDVTSILVQLVRNSIAHGGQPASEREALGKPGAMQLSVVAARTQRGIEVSVGDDGRGIDVDRVIERAIELGLARPEDRDGVTLQRCLRFLFHPRFTSATEASLDAGRGVGLALVRNVLQKHEGKISVKSEPDVFTRFHILIPVGEHA